MADNGTLTFVLGCAGEQYIEERLAQLEARAQSAALLEKPLAIFHRESGRDWPKAPWIYSCTVNSYQELQRCLDRARRLWGAYRLRQGGACPPSGCEDWGQFGSLTWGEGNKTALVLPPSPSAKDEPTAAITPTAVTVTATGNNSIILPQQNGASAQTAPDIAEATSLEELVLALVASQTGYKRSELHLEDDWQLDLAIDSLKLAAIVSALWERCGLGTNLDIDLSAYVTLGHLVAYLRALGAKVAAEENGGFAGPNAFGPNAAISAKIVSNDSNIDTATLNATPAVVPVTKVGVCGANEMIDWRQAAANHLGVPVEKVLLRSTAGWYHLRGEASEAPIVATDECHPLRGCLLYGTPGGPVERLGEPYLEPLEVMSWLKYRMDNRDNAWYYVIGALMAKFISAVEVREPMLPGPKLFLSNHQTALEGYLFPLLAPIISGLSIQGVAMFDHGVDWADAMSDFMFSHAWFPRHLLGSKRGFTFGDTLGLLRLVPGLEREMATRSWGLHIVASGQREWVARHHLSEVSSLWLEMALRLNIPIVPVRFKGGLPLENPGEAQNFPLGMGAQTVCFGPEISPRTLASLNSRTRKTIVLQALNDFDLGAEVPHRPDPAFAGELHDWLQAYGGDEIATLVFCCLRRFVNVSAELQHQECAFPNAMLAFLTAAQGQRLWDEHCTLVCPDDGDGRWVAQLARFVFGGHGPAVRVEGQEARIELGI